ncbi:hypothetical protein A2U01_0113140, partial [Trifolium medium]|nr:hypothetical protein [Trifolium medium]
MEDVSSVGIRVARWINARKELFASTVKKLGTRATYARSQEWPE